MTFKAILVSVLKYLVLVAIFFIVDMVSSSVLPIDLDWTPPVDQLPMVFAGLLLSAAVISLVISLIVVRSRWSGWKLIGATFISWLGCMTIMAQIETAWFAPALNIPRSLAYGVALRGIVSVAILAPLTVWIWGKAKAQLEDGESQVHLPQSPAEWTLKLAVIAVVYLALYFGFGYIVAWQNPALREMYAGGTDPVVFNQLYMTLLQIVRSALWVLFAIPVIRMTKGPLWRVALLVALLYALPMNIAHFIPNPVMPDPTVRLSHFIETATSNFIFGLVVTWLLNLEPGRQAEKRSSAVNA
jgi:hypothetical protein